MEWTDNPAIEDFLHSVNSDGRQTLLDLYARRFLRLDFPEEQFDWREPPPVMVLFKLHQPIIGAKVVINTTESVSLNLGMLHHLVALGNHFGYLFACPNGEVSIVPRSSLRITLSHEHDYATPIIKFNDMHLTVFESRQEAFIATARREKWVSRSGYHGSRTRSMKQE